MKVGDLVKITSRGPELFLVLGRSELSNRAMEGDASKFSDWLLIEIATGRKFRQVKRELEIVSEGR